MNRDSMNRVTQPALSQERGEEIQKEIRQAIGNAIELYMMQQREMSTNPFSIGSCVIIGLVDAITDFVATQERVAHLIRRGQGIENILDMPCPIAVNMRTIVLKEARKTLELFQKD